MSKEKQWDVVVIGAGIAGLAGAALLAQAGRKVLVIERRPILGGRAMVVQQDGFTLNYGYHFILGGRHSPHARVFRRLGLKPPWQAAHVSRFYQERYGALHRFPAPPLELWRTSLFDGPGRRNFFSAALKMSLTLKPEQYWRVPLQELLETLVPHAEARQFYLHLAQAIGFDSAPGSLSAGHWLQFMRLNLKSGQHPSYIVAWDEMFELLATFIWGNGGEIRTGTRVERIELDGDAPTVWTEHEQISAHACLVTVPAQHLPGLLPDGLPGWTPERLQGIAPTCGISLDLGLTGDWHKYAAIDVPGDNLVIACHSLWQPQLAPPGHTLLQAIHFLPPDRIRDQAAIKTAQDRILAAVARHYPGALDKIKLQRWLIHPMMTGARHATDQTWQDLLPIQPPGLNGLYFAGDTVAAPGELSNGAVQSAEWAAAAILRHVG